MSRKEVPRAGLVKAALAGKITNQEGAQALPLSVRQFQRLKSRVREEGVTGLCHRGRGRPSRRRLPPAVREQATTLLATTYAGFNDCHATEQLQERHHLALSRPTVRRLRHALGHPAKHRRRPPKARTRRTPEARMGALVQLDGSPFDWLEGRGPAMTLLGAIDDATGTVLALHFRPTEDLHGYTTLLQQLSLQYGLPLTLYGDRLSVFVRNDSHWTLDEQLRGAQDPTHFGRMLQALGVGYIAAGSPQAKGRIERLWGTLQDRLVSELRLRGIATLEAANAFLPEFLADFNRRFAHAPADATALWRPLPRDFARVLSCRYARTVARDNTVRLGARWVQLPRGRSYASCRVELRECLDGRLLVFQHGVLLTAQPSPGAAFTLTPRRGPSQDRRPRRRPGPLALTELAQDRRSPRGPLAQAPRTLVSAARTQRSSRPVPTHPWRRAVTRRGRELQRL